MSGTIGLGVTLCVSVAESQASGAPVAFDATVPPTGASFREWQRWLAGPPREPIRTDLPIPNTSALRAIQGTVLPRESFRPPPRVRIGVGPAQWDSIESLRSRSSRDLSAELHTAFRSANEDSARLVFGVIAMAIDRNVFPVDTLHAWLFTTDTVLQGLAVRGAAALLFEHGSPVPQAVDPIVGDSIVDRLLRYLVDGEPVWRSFWESAPVPMPFVDRSARPRTYPARIRGVPVSLVEKYRNRVDIVSSEADTVSGVRTSTIWIEPVRQLGPFVSIEVSSAGSFSWGWILVRVGNEWRIVDRRDYVT